MDLERFNADLARIYSLMPALQTPARPIPAVAAEGSNFASTAEVFARIDPSTFRLRAPVATPDGLVGPFRSTGDCLGPLSVEGSLHWYDPTMPAEDGDLVLIAWHPRVLEGIVKRGSRDYAWLTQYGTQPGPIATKLLKHIGGDICLLTTSGISRLGRNRVLGVLRYAVGPDGTPQYGSAEPQAAHHIGLNAASQIVSAFFTGVFPFATHGITFSAASPATNVDTGIDITVVTSGEPVPIDMTAGAVAINTLTGTTAWTVSATVFRDGSAIASCPTQSWGSSFGSFWTAGPNPQNFPLAFTFTDTPPAGSHTYSLVMSGSMSGTATNNANVIGATMKVREIKR